MSQIFGVYAIRDKVAENFGSVTLDTNDFTAKRNFGYAMSNTPTMQYAAGDLELYKIGELDSEKGMLTGIAPVVLICRGDEVLNA